MALLFGMDKIISRFPLTKTVRAHIEAYGCALNRGEAQEFESILRSTGWEVVDSPESANLIVVATCGVIETTELEMVKRAKHLQSFGKPLIITGCMATALREKIEAVAPSAEFVPPDGIDRLCDIAGVGKQNDWTLKPWPGTSCYTVPIATGCVGDCAYCITKIARGELKSRTVDQISAEVGRIGNPEMMQEIQLTAQDSASYGTDIGLSLPALLSKLTKGPRSKRFRIGMMNPRTLIPIIDGVVEAYSSPQVFKFLHVPVQSASDRILDSMGRGYSISDFEKIVERFRSAYPGLTLSTDIIVGYPGERDSDHRANVELVERISADIVNITRFSSRPGTRASAAKDKVPGWVAKERSRELTELRFRISESRNRKKIGLVKEAIVTEEGTASTMIARTPDYEQVVLRERIGLGSEINVKILDCSPIHLIGEIVR